MAEDYEIVAGIDWGSTDHHVCLLDAAGNRLAECSVEHGGPGLQELVNKLLERTSDPGRVAVGIEVPRGPVVETLLERGFHVFAINPKQLDRFRDRHSGAGAKDDRLDAFVAADALRTDRRVFRRLQFDDPHTIRLRELSRTTDELKHELNGLANRLRDQLWRYFPQLLQLVPGADEPWLWAILDRCAAPVAAARLTRPFVERLLKQHRIRRFSTDDLTALLRQPVPRVAPGTVEACAEHVALLLPRLRLVHKQWRTTEKRLEQLLDELAADSEQGEPRDAAIVRSFPGVGTWVATTLLAEASQPLAERDYQTLRYKPASHQCGARPAKTSAVTSSCDAPATDGSAKRSTSGPTRPSNSTPRRAAFTTPPDREDSRMAERFAPSAIIYSASSLRCFESAQCSIRLGD
jgi:transposase